MSSTTLAALVNVFDSSENGRSTDEKTAVRTGEVRRALLKLLSLGNYGRAGGTGGQQNSSDAAGDNS